MPGRLAELAIVTAVAAVITVVMAMPVLRAPSERIFGMEIVGRHHDPFTLMAQFSQPIGLGGFSQPVTDLAGAMLSRLSGPVAAYNWLILISFPLSAITAYLLARYLAISPPAAAVAALAYAFSPFHVAHAGYHPHIAQTQWMPLYLLALWRCLDRATPAAVAGLGAAAIAVTLSNFYGGLIAAVITPVAIAGWWYFPAVPKAPGALRRLGLTIGALALVAAGGVAYALFAAREIISGPAAFAFPRLDLFVYSAKWWSYLVPPVEHPFVGSAVFRFWTDDADGRAGLLEQQVSLGFGVIMLALVAVSWWVFRNADSNLDGDLTGGRTGERPGEGAGDRQNTPLSRARVPVLVLIALTALVCSLAPERTIGAFTIVRPSAILYDIVPMFRAYARFGVVVQLMAALLAGIGIDRLLRARTRESQVACGLLIALVAAEYAVSPSALWRDVLPTTAHRWLMGQGNARAIDCAPLNDESVSIGWLTNHRIDVLGVGPIDDCAAPNLPEQLAAYGYTHLLVRGNRTAARRIVAAQPASDLREVARMSDGAVFAVTTRAPAVYVAAMSGFYPREQAAGWTWRWMGASAAWTIVNTHAQPLEVVLDLELSAFHHARRLALRLDGVPLQSLAVMPARRLHRVGPFTMSPGRHQLTFEPEEGATVVSDVIADGERRPLSCALGAWHWTVPSESSR